MNTFKIFVLSIVQGITELLPISSSGHLILMGKLLDFDIGGDTLFLSVLHLGTTLAIIVFYRKTLFKNLFTEKKIVFYLKLLLASIPAAILGFLFEDYITSKLHSTSVIAISLIVVGVLFIVFENIKRKNIKMKIEDIPTWKMIIIGIGQSLALIPGTSRSGITTLTGMALGLQKYTAFKFSFILGIPILLGSSIYEVTRSYLSSGEPSMFTASMALVRMAPWILITFLVGYLSLIIVKKFNKKRWLTLFGIYRIILGLLILLLAI
jgi:undecaprenyl-diphosphatase